MTTKTAIERLQNVLTNTNMPGTCETSLAILRNMSVRDQKHAAVEFPRQFMDLAKKYSRFAMEVPEAVEAAQTAIELGL